MKEKAIVIIDMPDNCKECTFRHKNYCSSVESYLCGVNYKRLPISHVIYKPRECPLKYLSEEDSENHYSDEYQDGYTDGWNACIEVITG